MVDVHDLGSLSIVGAVADSAAMDAPPGVCLSPAGTHVYVTGSVSDSVAVVDVQTPTSPMVVGSVTDQTALLENPGICAVKADGHTLFVTAYAGNALVSITATRNVRMQHSRAWCRAWIATWDAFLIG